MHSDPLNGGRPSDGSHSSWSLLTSETSVAGAARTYGVTLAEIEYWRKKFLLGAERIAERPRHEEAMKDGADQEPQPEIGDLVLDNDILREALKPYPLDRKTSDA